MAIMFFVERNPQQMFRLGLNQSTVDFTVGVSLAHFPLLLQSGSFTSLVPRADITV